MLTGIVERVVELLDPGGGFGELLVDLVTHSPPGQRKYELIRAERSVEEDEKGYR